MKAPQAFRSISEVAASLGVPQHTLRSWESRFPFVRPVQRPDGRRYYRPSDVAILTELRRLLNEEKLSTKEIMLRHRAGGLAEPSASDAGNMPRLQGHVAALSAIRMKLVALLG